MCWLQDTGRHKFELAVSVMGVRVGNEVKWPRGAMIRTEHEGVGLSKTWFETGEKLGIEIRYDTGAQRLTQAESGRVTGVVARGPEGFVTFGAKAVAEIPMDGVAPAVANAVFHATGVRLRDLPLTPQRVWHALRAKRE